MIFWRFIVVGWVMACATSASYGLTWLCTETTIRPQADGTLPAASFEFRNDAARAVTISQVQVGCDCTTVELGQKIYAPGEKGVIVARLDKKGMIGLVRRTITVSTDEPGTQSQVLTLMADLPEALLFAPHDLRWAAGENRLAKTVDVLVNVPEGVALQSAWANNPEFKVELVTVVARSRYRIAVTPPQVAGPLQAVILLRASDPVPPGLALTFFVRVQ